MQYDRSLTHFQHDEDLASSQSQRDDGRYSPRRYTEKEADYYYESASARDLYGYSESPSPSYHEEERRRRPSSSRSLRGFPRNEPRFGGRSGHGSRPAREIPREMPPSTRYRGYGSRSSHHRRTNTDPSLGHPPPYGYCSNRSHRDEDQQSVVSAESDISFHDDQQPPYNRPRQDRSYHQEDQRREYPYHHDGEQPQRHPRIDRSSFRRSSTMDNSSGYQQRGGPRRHVSTDGLSYSEPHHPHPRDSHYASSMRRGEDDRSFRRSQSMRSYHDPLDPHPRQGPMMSLGGRSSSRRSPPMGCDDEHSEQNCRSSSRRLSSARSIRSMGYDAYQHLDATNGHYGTLEAEEESFLQRQFDALSMSSSRRSPTSGYDAHTDPAVDASEHIPGREHLREREDRLSPLRQRSPTMGYDSSAYPNKDFLDQELAHSDFQRRPDELSSPRRSPNFGYENTKNSMDDPLELRQPEQHHRRGAQRRSDRLSRRSLSMGYDAAIRTSKNKALDEPSSQRSDRLPASLSLSPTRTTLKAPPNGTSKKSISPSSSSVTSSLEKKRRKRKEKLLKEWGSTKDVPVQYLKRPPIDYSKLGGDSSDAKGENDTPLSQRHFAPIPPVLPQKPPVETPMMDDASGVLSEASHMDNSGVLSEASFMDSSDGRSLLDGATLMSGLRDMDPAEVVRRANLPPPPQPIPPPSKEGNILNAEVVRLSDLPSPPQAIPPPPKKGNILGAKVVRCSSLPAPPQPIPPPPNDETTMDAEVVRRSKVRSPTQPIPVPSKEDNLLDNRSNNQNTCPEEELDLRLAYKWMHQQGRGENDSSEEVYIQILPGVLDHLRRIGDTKRAIQADRIVPMRCVSCETDLMCIDNLKYVLCPKCEVVSSAQEGSCSEGRVQSMSGPRRHGTAVGLTYETFYKIQADILLR